MRCQSVRLMQREHTAAGTLYRSKRRAAINRIQYSKAPSLRNLPFASMLNAYMGYSLIRSELTKAIDYSNIRNRHIPTSVWRTATSRHSRPVLTVWPSCP